MTTQKTGNLCWKWGEKSRTNRKNQIPDRLGQRLKKDNKGNTIYKKMYEKDKGNNIMEIITNQLLWVKPNFKLENEYKPDGVLYLKIIPKLQKIKQFRIIVFALLS